MRVRCPTIIANSNWAAIRIGESIDRCASISRIHLKAVGLDAGEACGSLPIFGGKYPLDNFCVRSLNQKL